MGSEYGGLHYGIVLDNNNHHNSSIVTVIPLTSVKEGSQIHSNSVALGNDLYRTLKTKYDIISKALDEEEKEIVKIMTAFKVLVDMAKESLDKFDKCNDVKGSQQELDKAQKCLNATNKLEISLKEKDDCNKEDRKYLDTIGNEISNMKKGSIALINQITTISKMRIFDPKNAKGVLAGISLSEENMEKINQKVKELYVF